MIFKDSIVNGNLEIVNGDINIVATTTDENGETTVTESYTLKEKMTLLDQMNADVEYMQEVLDCTNDAESRLGLIQMVYGYTDDANIWHYGLNESKISRITKDITTPPTEYYSYLWNVPGSSSMTCAGITIPGYSKGIFITNGGADGILLGVALSGEYQGKLFVAYRSNDVWQSCRAI